MPRCGGQKSIYGCVDCGKAPPSAGGELDRWSVSDWLPPCLPPKPSTMLPTIPCRMYSLYINNTPASPTPGSRFACMHVRT